MGGRDGGGRRPGAAAGNGGCASRPARRRPSPASWWTWPSAPCRGADAPPAATSPGRCIGRGPGLLRAGRAEPDVVALRAVVSVAPAPAAWRSWHAAVRRAPQVSGGVDCRNGPATGQRVIGCPRWRWTWWRPLELLAADRSPVQLTLSGGHAVAGVLLAGRVRRRRGGHRRAVRTVTVALGAVAELRSRPERRGDQPAARQQARRCPVGLRRRRGPRGDLGSGYRCSRVPGAMRMRSMNGVDVRLLQADDPAHLVGGQLTLVDEAVQRAQGDAEAARTPLWYPPSGSPRHGPIIRSRPWTNACCLDRFHALAGNGR